MILLATNAFADLSGKYVKKNAVANIKEKGENVAFSIHSSAGQKTCSFEDTATGIDKDKKTRSRFFFDARKAYKRGDAKVRKNTFDRCRAMLTFSGDQRQLTVTTLNCDGRCGLSAAGSMDGVYKKKVSKKK